MYIMIIIILTNKDISVLKDKISNFIAFLLIFFKLKLA